MAIRREWLFLVLTIACGGCADDRKASGEPRPDAAVLSAASEGNMTGKPADAGDRIVRSDEEWKKILDPDAYVVLRKKGTERAFTGKYWDNHEAGLYVCAACGNPLFSSDTKFESGTGWPSFYKPLDPAKSVEEHVDSSLFMSRTEVVCHRCGGHLGHVFDDGPAPTGLRYCMNSAALRFEPKK